MPSIARTSCFFSRVIGNAGWRGFWRLLSSRRKLDLPSCGFRTNSRSPLVPGNISNTGKPASLSVYLRRKEIETGRFDENLIASRQLQFAKALPADFDLDQFFILAVIAYNLKANYRPNRENMGHMRGNCSLPIEGV